MNRTDAELFALCQTGDSAAFAKLVDRYQSVVWSVALSRTGDRALSEDVTQETFLCAWRTAAALKDPKKIRSWLCSIARNLSATALRKRGPIASSDALALRPDTRDESALDALVSIEAERQTWETLESLPESYREVLILYYREGRSAASVSEIIGISASAVHQRLSRGRSLMKDRLQGAVASITAATPPRSLGPAIALAVVGGARGSVSAGSLATASASETLTLLPLSILKGVSMKLSLVALAALVLVAVSLRHSVGFSSKGSQSTGPTVASAMSERHASEAAATSLPPPDSTHVAQAASLASLRDRLMRRVTTARNDRPEGRLVLPSVRQSEDSVPDPIAEFVAARDLWREGKHAEAIPEMQNLIENYPEHDVGLFATNILFDCLITEGPDAAEIFYWADLYARDETLLKDRPDLSERLDHIRVASLRTMAEEWEEVGDFQGCYLSYQSIVETLPDAPGLDEILYNAAICAEEAGLDAEAREAWTQLAAAFPDSPLAATARAHLRA